MINGWKKIKEVSNEKERVLEKTFILPNGNEVRFPIRNEGRSVGVLAVTKDQKVILVQQFRPGPEEILSELPGGFVDKDEDPRDAVKRELLEETGYTGDFEFVCSNITSPYSNEKLHNFVATNCHKTQQPHHDENEFLEVIEVPIEEFKQHLTAGKMSNLETSYMGLFYLNLL